MSENKENKKLNVPSLRFPEFSGEWEGCTISDFGKIITGMTPSTHISEYYINGSNLWASPADLGKSKYINNTSTKLSNKGFAKTRHIPMGAILITCIGSTIGKMGMATTEMSTNQQINSLVVNSNYDRDFVYYAIEHRFPHYLKDVATQAVPILSKSNFEKLKNYSTSKPEQQKIGKFLDLLEQKINIQSRIIEHYKTLIKALSDRLINSGTSTKVVQFSQLYTKAAEGGTPPTSESSFYNNGTIPFVKIEDLSSKYLKYNRDFITEIGLQKSSAWLVPSGSIIYSNGATIGSASINVYPVATKQGILGIVPRSNVLNEYLFYLMTSTYFKHQVYRIITEGTMKTAYLKDINNIICPLPDFKVQKKIVNILSSYSKRIETEADILDYYKAIKKYLVNKLFI